MSSLNQSIRRVIAGIVALFLSGSALRAQEPRSFALDATLGVGSGLGGGELRHRQGVALDALASLRLRPASHGVLTAGVSVGYQGYPIGDDVCQTGSRGQCLEGFPGLSYVGVLAGVEFSSGPGAPPGASVSLLAGPAFVHVGDHEREHLRGNTAGLQGRVDAAASVVGPVALVASVRGTVVPRIQGQALAGWAIGLGLRLR